jgi:undecaprenyl-diphosphatase
MPAAAAEPRPRRWARVAGPLACALAFAGLTIAVGLGALDRLDRSLHEDLVAGAGSPLAWIAVGLAWAGAGLSTTLVGIALVATRVPTPRTRAVTAWLLAIAAATALAWTVKPLLSRRRPEGIVDALAAARFGGGSDSFPSGHALTSALLAALVWHLWRGAAPRALAVIWALSVGASRLVLGVHWPSDVAAGAIAGIGLGLAWPLPRASGRTRIEP